MMSRQVRLLATLVLVLAALGLMAAAPAAADEGSGGQPSCRPGGTCVDPEPCPPEETCGFDDRDSDGFPDAVEDELGSDPADDASTPEHAFYPRTCGDGADNDLDDAIDLEDGGCTVDSDGDGQPDLADNCPFDYNPEQEDTDEDGTGDACDFDGDNDGFDDETEQLLGSDAANPESTPEHSFFSGTCSDVADNDLDTLLDADDPGCALDGDFDLVPDDADNCPTVYNPEQEDTDEDGAGDACVDSDGDGYFDTDELLLGSDPEDAASTPEFIGFPEVCSDGADNDLDGQVDGDDPGCTADREEAFSAAGPSDDVPTTGVVLETSQSPRRGPAALPASGGHPAGSGENARSSLGFALAGGLLLLASGALVWAWRRSGRGILNQ